MEDVECPVLGSLIATVTAVNEQRQDERKKENKQCVLMRRRLQLPLCFCLPVFNRIRVEEAAY